MTTTFEPKTVEEFINYYEIELKNELEIYNVQINKVGFLGFLLNILGHTHYDIKNYYDFLYKESFIATADTSENIHLHASLYGYFPSFATSAQATGNLEVDFNILPSQQANVVRRELYLNSPGQLLKFESEGYNFCTKASYKMILENNQYKTIIITEDGKSIQYPSPTAVLTPPILDTRQFFELEYNFKTTNYPANSFYTYLFKIEDEYIEDLEVYVKEKNNINEEKYEIKYIKYFETGSSKTVFLRKLTQNKYIIELGSGIRGKWLPQANIRLVIKATKGRDGNFLKLSQTNQSEPQQVILIDYDSNGDVVSTTNLSSNQTVLVKVESSENGINPLEDLELRDDVIKYIQTRDNLVSETDFYNIAQKYMPDFKFLFKKIHVYDNIFHLCRILRDKYQTVLYSTNHYIEESSFTDLYHPVFTIDGNEMISPFLYKFNDIMNWYDGYLLYENMFVYLNSINLTDDVPPTYDIPPLYFNIIYNNVDTKTTIQLKSYQDISLLTFKITIDQLQISEQNLVPIDVNTFEIVYYENDGIIFDEIDIQIDGYDTGVKTFVAIVESINQVYNITDILNLTRYTNNGIDYLVGIPIIDKISFDDEKEYFLDKINNFILGSRFLENRMISDNIQFRFLNSYMLKTPFLEESTVQGKNIFDIIKQWKDDVISLINDPIATPSHGDRFLIGDSPTGVFVGHEKEISQWYELSEKLEIECNEASTLTGAEYFFLNTISTSYYVWYNIDTSSTDPLVGGATGIEINILSTDSSDDVAYNTATTLTTYPDFNIELETNVVKISNVNTGNVTDSSDFNTGFNLTIIQQGINGHYEYTLPEEFDGILVLGGPTRYYYNEVWNLLELKLPLKLKVEINVDQHYLITNNINLYEEKEVLLLQLADLLQKNYSTTNILYYDSQIIDFVHLERPYIKFVEVEVTDSTGLVILHGIESKEDKLIIDGLKVNKFNIVKYTPVFWYWDVDNIELITLINQE